MNPKVDAYFTKAQKRQKELEKLRMIIRGKRDPTFAPIEKLADALEAPACELLQ